MFEQGAELDDVLGTCLDAMQTQDWTVEDCLSHYAAYREVLEPLLRTAQQFRSEQLAPSPVFQAQAVPRLRGRLKQSPRLGSSASVNPGILSRSKARPQPFYAQRRFATAFVALMVILGLAAVSTGTIYAAGSALPGEPLYPVEQTVEQVQLGFAPPGKALGLRMDFAEKRLGEAEQLRQKGDNMHMQQALDGYNQLVSDATQMVGLGSGADDQALLDMFTTRLGLQQARLEALLSTVPPAAQAGITRAIQASKRGQARAAQAIKDHGGGKPDNTPGGGQPGNGPGGGPPNITPAAGPGNPAAGNGNGETACSNGTSLPGAVVGQAHRLAQEYNVPYTTIQDLLCSGLTLDQVKARLASATPVTP